MDIVDVSKRIEQWQRDLGALSGPEDIGRVARRLADLELRVEQAAQMQLTLLAALRARDVVAREGAGRTLAPPARLVEISARDGLSAEGGLYPLRWDGTIAYRWTGPGESTVFRVWLDRSEPVVFEITLHDYGDPRNEGALELRVDGAPIALQTAAEKLLRSDPFPVVAGSLLTEIAVRTPFMSEMEAPKSARARSGRARGHPRSAALANARGFAFNYLRFMSPG